MEIQKENHLLEQFEKTKTFKRFFSTLLRFDEELDCFISTEKWRDKEAELLTAAWWMFAEVSKAQSAPESFEQAYSEIFSPIIKRPYPRLVNGDYKYSEIDQGWKLWRAAKAQAVPEWISVEDKLPETEPNTDGVVCAVVCSLGNVYRARYMHDVDIGVDTKYWSEFAVNYNGREYEHYEINAKISHWIPLPDAPQEPANE